MMRAGLAFLLSLSLAFGAAGLAAAQPVAGANFSPVTYALAVNDKINVTVYNEPSLSGTFTINADGALAYPLIGNVQAAGKTPEQLRQTIETMLSDGYVKTPKVSLDVLTFRPFYIYGEVNSPGEYPYSNGLTVQNAIALAKGFTYRANQRGLLLKHAGEVGATEKRVSGDTPLMPGDTLRVTERFF